MTIVHTPTQADYDRLIKVLKEKNYEGYVLYHGEECRENCGKNFCIRIDGNSCHYSDKNFYQVEYPNTPIITVDEYINGGKATKAPTRTWSTRYTSSDGIGVSKDKIIINGTTYTPENARTLMNQLRVGLNKLKTL